MDNAARRTEIAAALTLAGLQGHASRPAVPAALDAWPQWGGMDRAGGYAFVQQWRVLVVLPQADDVTADSFADQYAEAIVERLGAVMFVDGMDPATIPAEGSPGGLYALLISGHSE